MHVCPEWTRAATVCLTCRYVCFYVCVCMYVSVFIALGPSGRVLLQFDMKVCVRVCACVFRMDTCCYSLFDM